MLKGRNTFGHASHEQYMPLTDSTHSKLGTQCHITVWTFHAMRPCTDELRPGPVCLYIYRLGSGAQ